MSRAQYIRKFGIPILIIALVLEIAVSGAYGVMAAQNGGSREISPAQVLTAQDLKEILGQDFKAGKAEAVPGQNFIQCTYSGAKGVVHVGVVQAVSETKGKTAGDSPETFFENLKDTMGKTETLDGLGKDNIVVGDQLLVVLQSGRMLAISYDGFSKESKAQLLADLGKRAVQNLNRMAYPAE